jgi:hypothetical protein
MTRRWLVGRWIGALLTVFAALTLAPLEATGRSSKGSGAKASHPRAARPKASKPATVTASRASVPRTATGKIQRSEAARHAFARQTGYPNGRPGYVIDHIGPLACGDVDAPSNMQWQTIAEGKAKDRTKRVGCR